MHIFPHISGVLSVFLQFTILFNNVDKFIHLDIQWYPVNSFLKLCMFPLYEYAMFYLAVALTVDI